MRSANSRGETGSKNAPLLQGMQNNAYKQAFKRTIRHRDLIRFVAKALLSPLGQRKRKNDNQSLGCAAKIQSGWQAFPKPIVQRRI